jgi:hypothetical protein
VNHAKRKTRTSRLVCAHQGSPSYIQMQKGLSFISSRQRRKEGTFRASGLAGIEPTPARSVRAGYANINLPEAGQEDLKDVALRMENLVSSPNGG